MRLLLYEVFFTICVPNRSRSAILDGMIYLDQATDKTSFEVAVPRAFPGQGLERFQMSFHSDLGIVRDSLGPGRCWKSRFLNPKS